MQKLNVAHPEELPALSLPPVQGKVESGCACLLGCHVLDVVSGGFTGGEGE